MDPLVLEVLRFGTAILAGGLVAVIAQRIAFRHARVLQLDDSRRRDAGLRRALASEMRENMHRLGGPVVTAGPSAPIVRLAWDSARALPLDTSLSDAISSAYAAAATVDLEVGLIATRSASKGIVKSVADEVELAEKAFAMIRRDAQIAYDRFATALDRLMEGD